MMAYERLEAWRAGHELVVAVYRSTERYPPDERFGLTAQTRRAATSIPTNIAEDIARRGPAEFRRFLDKSLGSLSEVAYLIRLARDLGMLSADEWGKLDVLRHRAGALTWRLYRSIKSAVARSR
jgi:four helix bundle protein